MYPYFRLAKIVLGAKFGRPLKIDETGRLSMIVWPGDIDFYPEMNNGRHMTLMDLGRIDLAIRTGLFSIAISNRWSFAVAGASLRYRYRLRPFRRFELLTELLGHDGRWFYFFQKTRRGHRICSSALIRAGVTSPKGIIPAEKVLDKMGHGHWNRDLPEWVKSWIKADDLRPSHLIN